MNRCNNCNGNNSDPRYSACSKCRERWRKSKTGKKERKTVNRDEYDTVVRQRDALHTDNEQLRKQLNQNSIAFSKALSSISSHMNDLQKVKEKLESVGICINLETVHDAIDNAITIIERMMEGNRDHG